MKAFLKETCVKNLLFLSSFFILQSTSLYALTYTMGISGAQSATVSATSTSPDKFYDQGGVSSNYYLNLNATYTFNCAAGQYVRMKVNSIAMESGWDYFKVYDGTSTSARLISQGSFTGTVSTAFMYVSTTGSLTVEFYSSDDYGVDTGWDIDVWVDSNPGQTWDGSTSTEFSTASNWEGDVLPYNYFTSVYIPSGLTNYPVISNTTSPAYLFDLRIATGASMNYSSTLSGHGLFSKGNLVMNGTFNHSATFFVQINGGTITDYATISGTGNISSIFLIVGYNRLSYYKLLNSISILDIDLSANYGASTVDMNGYDLSTYYVSIPVNTSFLQKTGTLSIEQNSASINDVAFDEGTGTTYFSSGTIYVAGNQTIPSITYYNLKIRTNNTKTATIGTGTLVSVKNNLTILNPSTAGGIATNTSNEITVGGNFYLGTTGNALTLNMPYPIYRSIGLGTLTMGNVSAHAINITYANTTIYAISGFSPPVFYGTVTFNSSSDQRIIPATSYNNLTFNGTGIKTFYDNTLVNANTTITAGTVNSNSYNLILKGNFTNSGTFNATTANVTFSGTSAQTISGSSVTSFYNGIIANTSGDVTLGINSTIQNSLTLTSGKFITQGYTLSIGTNLLNGSITGGSSSSYIVAYDNSGTIGYVKNFVNSTANYSFPIGDATNFTPLTLTLNSGTLSSADITVYTKPIKITGLDPTITDYVNRFWDVSPTGITLPNYSVQYTYANSDIVGSETGFVSLKKSGATWNNPSYGSFSFSTILSTGSFTSTTNTFVWNGITTFSLFGGATPAIILPIELLAFKGEKGTVSNLLEWTTASEINNDYFTLEKSTDGIEFEIVGNINGAGNFNDVSNYSMIDDDLRNVVNYYRLKQTDFDGNYTYSSIISIDNSVNEKSKEVLYKTNLLGQTINETYSGIVIIYYSDGSFKKVIQ